ncbi:unnamed protein product [Leptidea sinapis]|uniref:RRM domain-containing protein n=1 Tax=Leptidea sinapis TaxID=189913 RepID=A0A5E4Q4W8_9NEOP|nr:unnamed protein product [Leptidea sinapis]
MADSDYLDSMENNHLDGTNGSLNMNDNSLGGGDEASGTEVPDLAAIKARVQEMEEEAEKLKQMQTEVDKAMSMGSPPGLTSPLNMSLEEKIEADNRSVYVGNVDYGATAEEVTILCNKFDGHPKGFAYIEFGDKDSDAKTHK